jgi:hypothetical protein
MERKNFQFESGFRVILGNRFSQAPEIMLPPGMRKAVRKTATGVRTRGSCRRRNGTATVNGKRYFLGEGTFCLLTRR